MAARHFKNNIIPKPTYSTILKTHNTKLKVINKLNKLNLTIQNGKLIIMDNNIFFYTTENIIIKEKLHDFGYITKQDPYHTPNKAMGLSFSVPNGK